MKNSFKFLPLILGLIVASCAVKEIEPTPIPQEIAKMKVTMTSLETKTAMVQRDENTFTPKWTKGDRLGVFVRAKGVDIDKNISTGALTEDTESATFTAEVTAPQEDGTYEFYTYYPYSELDDNDYKSVRVAIPSEQHPANGSFDPKADILTGYPLDVDVTAGQSELERLSIQFLRKSSIVRFLIPQCEGFDGIDGETPVSEVTVYFDKNVTGVATWSIIDKADLTLEEAGASNAVTLKYSETHKITDPLWLSIAPVSGVKKLTFAFKVADNAYLYAEANLPDKGASFAAGKMKKYDIPINATSWSLKSFSNKYVKVTETPTSWLGKYLIVGENGDDLYACDQKSVGSWGSCSKVIQESDGSIKGNSTIDSYAFEVVNGLDDEKYALKFQDGKYVGAASSKFNKEDSQNKDKTDFDLSITDEDYATISNSTYQLRYNPSNLSYGLRFYSGESVNPVSLYKQIEDYSEIVPVIADPEDLPEEVAKEGVTDATFTVGIANLSKYNVSIPTEGGVDGIVITKASVSYASGTATVTYSVAVNTGADRDGWIILQAGTTEKKIEIHQATGIVLPEITPVDDQDITYEASDSRTFDVTITNVGSFDVTCETDGTVVTTASAALKEDNVYTVTYTVTENEGETQRDGTVTVKCSTVSQVVNIKQSYNASLIKTYVLTELANIASDDIVIPIGNEIYAMSNDNGTTSGPSAVNLSDKISDNKIVGKIADNLLWNISGNATDGYTFYPNGVTDKWLYCNTTAESGSNGNMRVGAPQENNRNVFKLNEDNILETNDSYKTRYLSIYTSGTSVPDWRGYINKNNNPASMSFYVLDDGKVTPTITSEDKSISTLESQDVSEMFQSDSDGEVSYTVSGGTLNGTIFSATEPGDYTVTFTQKATTTYKPGQKEETIHVTTAPTLEATTIDATGDDTEKKITVEWVEVGNAAAYTVHCNSSSFNVEVGVETYDITDLEYGVEYDIFVTASAEGYYSSDSEHKIVVLTDPTKQDLDAPVISTNVSGTTVTVNWTDVANATSYFVECGTHSTTVNAGVQTAQFTCTAGSYEVYVTAKADGFNDGKSDVEVAEVYEQLVAPANFAESTITPTTISVSWSAVTNATAGYQVSKNGTDWTDVATTSYTFEGLTASTQYDLYVRAKAVGYYRASNHAQISVSTIAPETSVSFQSLGYASWGESSSFSGSAKDEVSQTQQNVTLTYTRNGSSCYANTSAIRFYKSNKLTFSVPEGCKITSVVWNGSGWTSDVTTNIGTCSSTTSGLSWSGNAQSVTFTRPSNASSYVTLSSCIVKYVGTSTGGDTPGGEGSIPADVTFDLTTDTSTSASKDLVTWSDNGTTMTLAKGSGTDANNYLGSSSQTRMYNNNLLTITPKSGATMKSVKITATEASYNLPTTGWTNGSASVSGSVVTVTPTDGTKAISVNPGGTKRITKVEVIYN